MPREVGLSRSPPNLQVAAGILRDDVGRVLITDRKRASSMSDFWEFPGGKLRHGESAAAALQRELAEELGIRVDCFEHFQQLEHRYPDAHVVIDFFLVLKWSGVPEGLDGQNLAWVAALDLDARRLLPADVLVVKALRDAALRQNVVSKR